MMIIIFLMKQEGSSPTDFIEILKNKVQSGTSESRDKEGDEK
jgi:hypothetical protein